MRDGRLTRHLIARNSKSYQGRHRENEMPAGVGLIPLGNRNRARFALGDNVAEERDSIGQYDKYIKLSN